MVKTTNNSTLLFSALLSLSAFSMQSSFASDLPLGDGKISTSAKVGFVFACNQNFRGGGALHAGNWIHGSTWTPEEKLHVKGNITWPYAKFSVSATSEGLGVKGNSLPVGQPTGKFPIAQSDPAYQFDTNPNPIKPTALNFKLPLNPLKADTPSCLSMGMIGFTLTGVPIYNALNAAGRDAVAHEVQDLCDGHPQGKGQYHYHSGSPCLPGYLSNEVVGYALDGFPIMGTTDASGKQLTNSDLDACHGQAVSITVDGRSYSYAYRMTHEYPYTIGCYVGEVSDSIKQATMGKPKGQQGMGKNANPNGGLNKSGGRQRPLNNGGRRPPKL